jgi:hypothetical protein
MDSTTEILEQHLNPGPSPNPAPAPVLENHPTQSATTIDGWRSALFGIPFLAAGVLISLAALGFVSGRKNAPDWVIGIIGPFFFLGGLFFLIHGLRGAMRKARYFRDAAERPGQPWLYDFHWRQEGISFSAFNTMLGRLLAALGWNAFLIPFFWIGLNVRGAFLLLIFASLFALIGLVFWYRWAQMLADLLRYGNSLLNYDAFPFFLGGTLRARLRAPHYVSDMDAFTLTLRCIQEKYITTGSGNNRTTRVVCYELYKDAVTLTRDRLAGLAGGEIPVEFRLPANQPTTSLASTPPVYWEIEAHGQSTKVRYQAYFLVPVYKVS